MNLCYSKRHPRHEITQPGTHLFRLFVKFHTAYPVMSLSSFGGLQTTSRLSSPTRRVTRTSRGRPSNPDTMAAGYEGRVWVSVMLLLPPEEAFMLWRGRKGVTGGMGGRLRGLHG